MSRQIRSGRDEDVIAPHNAVLPRFIPLNDQAEPRSKCYRPFVSIRTVDDIFRVAANETVAECFSVADEPKVTPKQAHADSVFLAGDCDSALGR